MKLLLICLALLTLVARTHAGSVAFFAAALDGEALGQAVSFYDDASGQLSLTFVATEQPDIESARWALVANELAAPLGEAFQPTATHWDAPYFHVTVQLVPKEIPAPQMQLLEIRLANEPMPQVIPVMVYPAAQRDALVEQLAQHRLFVDRQLEPVRALLDRYGLRHQGVDADRALQSNGPGIYFLIADDAPPPTATRHCSSLRRKVPLRPGSKSNATAQPMPTLTSFT